MGHYHINEWVDYVRDALDPARTAAMRAHLDAGCEPCRDTAQRLSLVAAQAKADLALDPPAHLVHFAKAAFSVRRSTRVRSLPLITAKLVFNSLDAAPVAGMRGSREDISRQTLYEAGDFSVHLRFEQLARATRVSLVGQIANRRAPEPPMSYVPVFLTRGRMVVARSLSNEFGEFQVEYEPHAALQLHIPVAGGRQRIRVALTDLHGIVDEGGGGASATAPKRRTKRGKAAR